MAPLRQRRETLIRHGLARLPHELGRHVSRLRLSAHEPGQMGLAIGAIALVGLSILPQGHRRPAARAG